MSLERRSTAAREAVKRFREMIEPLKVDASALLIDQLAYTVHSSMEDGRWRDALDAAARMARPLGEVICVCMARSMLAEAERIFTLTFPQWLENRLKHSQRAVEGDTRSVLLAAEKLRKQSYRDEGIPYGYVQPLMDAAVHLIQSATMHASLLTMRKQFNYAYGRKVV